MDSERIKRLCKQAIDKGEPVEDYKFYYDVLFLLKELEELGMDNDAIQIVKNYIMDHLDKSDPEPEFDIYIVWKCKALQDWKYLISSSLFDGMYYELTFNGDKSEWYLDAYKKFENKRIFCYVPS